MTAWVPFALSNEQTTEISKAKLGVAFSSSLSLSKLDANDNSGLLSPRSGYENVKFKISDSPSVSAFKVLSRNFKTAPNASRAVKMKKIGTRKGAIIPIAHFAAARRIVSITFSRRALRRSSGLTETFFLASSVIALLSSVISNFGSHSVLSF